MSKVWINGRYIGSKKANISVFDRGFLYGDGVFETMRSYHGVVFRLADHIERLFRSLKLIKIKVPYSKGRIKAVIYNVLAINKLKDAYIRLSVSRGEGRMGIDTSAKSRPTVVVVASDFRSYPRRMYEEGISAKVVSTRQNEYTPISRIKSFNFLNNILARIEAKSRGFDEAILMNTSGLITEAATSNIFLVSRSSLKTPSVECGILPGVTRRVILNLANRLGIKVYEKRIPLGELTQTDEVFLTNSLFEILPVTRIDSKRIGKGRPGYITGLLQNLYTREADLV